MSTDLLTTPKEDYDEIVARISLPDSPVGIDAKYTHAIIIAYLRQVSDRLANIEQQLTELRRAETGRRADCNRLSWPTYTSTRVMQGASAPGSTRRSGAGARRKRGLLRGGWLRRIPASIFR
jgi:hypothetical protein